MRIFVTGANGFIGAQIVSALREAGHYVVCGVSKLSSRVDAIGSEVVVCDLEHDTSVDVWLPRLRGSDAVVNCAGILRETRRRHFDAIHRQAPCALFYACERAGIKKVVQISALGDAEDVEFIRSKHQGDACLQERSIDWVVLRPSVIYSADGSYGGTSLLRALAAFPVALFVPGNGRQKIQPLAAADLARGVVRLLETGAGNRQIVEAVGPEILSVTEYLQIVRRWLGLSGSRVVHVPSFLVWPLAWLGEVCSNGPLGMTMYRMLERGNVGGRGADERFAAMIGFQPRSVAQTLATRPSYTQDRWHARLYFVRPVLNLSLGLLWVISGLVGILTPFTEARAVLSHAGIDESLSLLMVYGACGLDILIGGLLLVGRAVMVVGTVMLVLLIGYTAFLGVVDPRLWLEPFGALIKNIPLIPAVLAMMAMETRR